MDIRARKKARERKRKLATLLFSINFIAFIIWLVAQTINIYEYAVVGAIYEILWLPLWGCFFIIPFISIYNWHHDGYKRKSGFLFVLFVSVFTLMLVVTGKHLA